MAWRIETQLIRGEIDNRTRGRITGRLWFAGRTAPVELDLRGDARRDLAGRRLVFVNPAPEGVLDPSFAAVQLGVAGDFTASRKVKVPDFPLDAFYGTGKALPWHWGNSVYLEWFSRDNGRVVIQSAAYELTVSTESAWEMSAAEEEALDRKNNEDLQDFFREHGILAADNEAAAAELSDAGEAWIESDDLNEPEGGSEGEPDEEASESWKAESPLSEEEADDLVADSDRLTERLLERLHQAEEGADLESILHEELERRRAESEQRPLSAEEREERQAWLEQISRAAEELAQDPDFQAELKRQHPVSERARELVLRVMTESEEGHWAPANAGPEHPVTDLVRSMMKAGGKLAGALDGRAWPPEREECALCIAWLKRAGAFLEDAQLALESCREENLIPLHQSQPLMAELAEVEKEIQVLIEHLRERLSRDSG